MDVLFETKWLDMSVLELIAAFLGLISVWLTVKQNVWCWPIGAVMVALYTLIFWHERLYADSGLQVVYFVLQFYGWYQWLHGGREGDELPPTRAEIELLGVLVVLGGLASGMLGWALRRWTDQDVAYLDSVITVFSLIAQWMLAKKLLENWLVWMGVDALAVVVYFWKGLYPTSVLYGIFLLMCVAGYLEWERAMLKETKWAEPLAEEE
jgi:nicotinamide mononucleotide transporter